MKLTNDRENKVIELVILLVVLYAVLHIAYALKVI